MSSGPTQTLRPIEILRQQILGFLPKNFSSQMEVPFRLLSVPKTRLALVGGP